MALKEDLTQKVAGYLKGNYETYTPQGVPLSEGTDRYRDASDTHRQSGSDSADRRAIRQVFSPIGTDDRQLVRQLVHERGDKFDRLSISPMKILEYEDGAAHGSEQLSQGAEYTMALDGLILGGIDRRRKTACQFRK